MSYKPTKGMIAEAKKGLAWRREFGRGGTAVGIARARDIVNGKELPLETVKRMYSFFSRHEKNKQAEGFRPGEEGYPSNSRISWALWGSDQGYSWSRKIVESEKQKQEKQMSDNIDKRHIVNVSETDASYVVEFAKHNEPEVDENSYEDDKGYDEEKSYDDERDFEIVFTPERSEDEYIFTADLSEDEVFRFYKDKTVRQEIQFQTRSINTENRTATLVASSEEAVERSFGLEILSHRSEDIDMSFIASGKAPLLYNHNDDLQIGKIERFYLDEESKRTIADVKFSRNKLANEIFTDVADDIRNNVSIGYQVLGMRKVQDASEPTFAVRFKPLEVSIVSIPADPTVGVVRDGNSESDVNRDQDVETTNINNSIKKERKMSEENTTPKVEVSRNDIAKDNAQILEMGDAFGQEKLARDFVGKGASVNEFRSALLGKIKESKEEVALTNVDMSAKEQRDYSILNVIRAQVTGNWDEAGLEKEVSDTIAKRIGKSARGVYLPQNIDYAQRDLTKGTNSAGGFLVPENHLGNEFIDRLKAKSVVTEAGARIMQGEGDIVIPKLSSGADNVAFVSEGSAPSESALTFEQVTLSPKGLRGYIDISRILANNSNPSAEQIVRDDLVGTFATKIDQTAIKGGGSNEPTGIIGNSDVPVVAIGTNGGAITYAKLIDMYKSVINNNAMFSDPKWLINPVTEASLRQTLKSSADTSSNFIFGDDRKILGYDALVSTNVPGNLSKGTGSNLSGIVFGSFDQLMIANFSPVDILVDPYSLSTSGSIRVNAYVDMDLAVRHPEAFAVCKDVVAS